MEKMDTMKKYYIEDASAHRISSGKESPWLNITHTGCMIGLMISILLCVASD
jgi:hypothetical protein